MKAINTKYPEFNMRRVLWLIYQPYKWLIFAPLLGLSAAFFSIVAVILVYLISPKAGNKISSVGWSRFSSAITPMTVKVKGRENIDNKQSYVVISNHQSHFDIFVVAGWLQMDLKWVMKKELRKVPFVGWACEKLEFIIIDRTNRQKAIESLQSAKDKIVNGTGVMFFPEGTRSKDGEIGQFKKGAFKMALDLKLPILPITIKGTRKILASGSFNLIPGHAEMIIHKPIPTTGMSDENLFELIDLSRNIISDEFYKK